MAHQKKTLKEAGIRKVTLNMRPTTVEGLISKLKTITVTSAQHYTLILTSTTYTHYAI